MRMRISYSMNLWPFIMYQWRTLSTNIVLWGLRDYHEFFALVQVGGSPRDVRLQNGLAAPFFLGIVLDAYWPVLGTFIFIRTPCHRGQGISGSVEQASLVLDWFCVRMCRLSCGPCLTMTLALLSGLCDPPPKRIFKENWGPILNFGGRVNRIKAAVPPICYTRYTTWFVRFPDNQYKPIQFTVWESELRTKTIWSSMHVRPIRWRRRLMAIYVEITVTRRYRQLS